MPLQMSEQNSQGRGKTGPAPVPIHAPPGQADNSCLLTKINGNCCSNTRPLAVIKAVNISVSKEHDDYSHSRKP